MRLLHENIWQGKALANEQYFNKPCMYVKPPKPCTTYRQ